MTWASFIMHHHNKYCAIQIDFESFSILNCVQCRNNQPMCDRILAESGKECEYFSNFYDDDFIERSSIGYYQYFNQSSLNLRFLNLHPNNNNHSIKPLLPPLITDDSDNNNNNNEIDNIYQHPYLPSQSYINRLQPKKTKKDINNSNSNNKDIGDDNKDKNTKNLSYLIPIKGAISGKNSTIPSSINELINNNFELLESKKK
eukprot:327383_1